jgi:hypothetical protein
MDDKTGHEPNDHAKTDAAPEERANLGQKEANLQARSKAKLSRMSARKPGVAKQSKNS